MGGDLTRKVLVTKVEELVEEFYPPHTHLRMGQVMWPAVDETENSSYGKSIERTRLKPVFLDLIHRDDIEALLNGEKAKSIRQRAVIRLFDQAKEQGGVLTNVDVGTMTRLSPHTISNYIKDFEMTHERLVPGAAPSMIWGRLLPINVRFVTKSLSKGNRWSKLPGKPGIPRRRLPAMSKIISVSMPALKLASVLKIRPLLLMSAKDSFTNIWP